MVCAVMQIEAFS